MLQMVLRGSHSNLLSRSYVLTADHAIWTIHGLRLPFSFSQRQLQEQLQPNARFHDDITCCSHWQSKYDKIVPSCPAHLCLGILAHRGAIWRPLLLTFQPSFLMTTNCRPERMQNRSHRTVVIANAFCCSGTCIFNQLRFGLGGGSPTRTCHRIHDSQRDTQHLVANAC
jgi:hypothetical protein